MKNTISWFEIPSTQLDRAQPFYEAVLNCKMRREPMGPSEGAVFPYDGEGVGGCLMAGPTAPAPGAGGTIALGRQALPPGMGFFAHITDLDGNRVGLHALA